LDGGRKEAPSPIRNQRFHRLSRHSRDEHSPVQTTAGINGHPLPVVFLDVLGIAERACGGTQGKKWDARYVAISGRRLHRTRAEREYGGLCRSCLEDLRALAGLDPASHESLRVAIHEMNVAALNSAAEENAIGVLYQIYKALPRPFHHGIGGLRLVSDPALTVEIVA